MELTKAARIGAATTANGRIFFRNPLDAKRGLGDMRKMAQLENLAYSGDSMLEQLFKKNRYRDLDTPLSKYCFPLGFGLDLHIWKLLEGREGENALRVLDVGAGTCSQWKEIVRENKGRLEFSAVALSGSAYFQKRQHFTAHVADAERHC